MTANLKNFKKYNIFISHFCQDKSTRMKNNTKPTASISGFQNTQFPQSRKISVLYCQKCVFFIVLRCSGSKGGCPRPKSWSRSECRAGSGVTSPSRAPVTTTCTQGCTVPPGMLDIFALRIKAKFPLHFLVFFWHFMHRIFRGHHLHFPPLMYENLV